MKAADFVRMNELNSALAFNEQMLAFVEANNWVIAHVTSDGLLEHIDYNSFPADRTSAAAKSTLRAITMEVLNQCKRELKKELASVSASLDEPQEQRLLSAPVQEAA